MNKKEYAELIKEGTHVVDFYADWCSPCKAMSPIIEELQNDESIDAKIHKIDIMEDEEISKSLKILSIPTLIFYKDGKEFDKISGATSKDKILQVLGQ